MIALILYAFFGILYSDLGSPSGTVTAVLGLVAVLVYGTGLRSSAPLWLLLAAVLVQLLSWQLGVLHHPQFMEDTPKLDRLAKLFIFVAIAWWLGGSSRNTLMVWSLALMGYLIAAFTHGGGIQEWLSGLQGQRVGFGIRNLQHGSMLFGVAFLGLVVFARRLWKPGCPRLVWPGRAVWSLAILLCGTGIVIGQTRAVWLALIISLPVAAAIWLAVSARSGELARMVRPLLMTSGAMLVVVALGLYVFHDLLVERVLNESGVIARLLDGDLANIPYTSIGIRINSWIAAFQWILERPIVGWGGDARTIIIDHTPWLPAFVKEQFGHLHNFLIEIWAAYGVLGVAVIGLLAYWIGRGTWLAWRYGAMPGDIALFGAAFFVYWVVVNQFESYNSFGTGVYVHNLVVGGLVTHIWAWQAQARNGVILFRFGSRGHE
ncbi:O-antigen ligase family protein [Halomonas sp. THAF12]